MADNYGGLFGLLGGGGGSTTTADLYGDLFTPKQLAAIQRRESQAKMAGLLGAINQAAAPSEFKKGWGSTLGSIGAALVGGGTEAGDKAATTALGGQLNAAKIAQLRQAAASKAAYSQAIDKLYGPGGPLAGDRPAAGAVPAAPPPMPSPVNPLQPAPAPGPDVAPAPTSPAPGGFAFGTGAPRPFGLPGASPPWQQTGMPPGDPQQQLAMLMQGGGLLGAGGGGPTPPFSEEEEDSLPPPDTVIPSGGGGLLNPDAVKLASSGGSGGGRDPLDIIEQYESGGRNIMQQVVPPGGGYNPSVGRVTGPSSAGGYYQMIDPTWRASAAKAGVDTEQYPTAISAPKEVQRKVAQQLYDEQGYAPWAPYNKPLAQAVGWRGGSGQDRVIPSGRGVSPDMLMQAQFKPGGAGAAAPQGGGLDDPVPGIGLSMREIARIDALAAAADEPSPFKTLLDAYYKSPGYLGQATTAQEAAKEPFARGLATHSSQLQLFRELAAKGLSIVPDGKGGYTMGTITGAPDALAAGDNARATSDQKEYQSYVKDQQMRGQPVLSQFDWDIARRKSSATSINTTEGMEAAQTRARLAIDQKAAQEATEVAMSARRTMPLLDQVIELADKTPGGWAGPASATMAKAFSAVGIPVSEGMSNAELLQSIGQRLIPIVREPGATAAVEMDAYLRAVPGLMQSQEGRRKVADMTKAIAQRSIEIARVYRENVGAPNLYEKLAELDKPVFSPAQRAAIETQPSITTPYGTITPVR